jgi:hypothetical protein
MGKIGEFHIEQFLPGCRRKQKYFPISPPCPSALHGEIPAFQALLNRAI